MRYLGDDSFAPPHFTPHFFINLASQFWPFTIQCSTLWRVAYSQRWVLRKSATSFILKICYIRYYEDTSLNTKNLKVCVIRYQTHLCYTNILTVNPSLPQGCEIKPKEKGTIVTASRLNNSTEETPRPDVCGQITGLKIQLLQLSHPFIITLYGDLMILWIRKQKTLHQLSAGIWSCQWGSPTWVKTVFFRCWFQKGRTDMFCFRDHEDPWVNGFWYMSTWYKWWILPV